MQRDYMRFVKAFVSVVGLFNISIWAFTAANAHDVVVHREITRRAIAQSDSLTSFLGSVFGYDRSGNLIDPEFGKLKGGDWIILGSDLEDEGSRSLNHFYDPIDKQGLTDFIIPIPQPFTGISNSFDWATVETPTTATDTTGNDWGWRQARAYEYTALTSYSKDDRDEYFGYMFRSVGQVMHLLEDTSQPEHVRNTEHYHTDWTDTHDLSPLRSYIEKYGSDDNNYRSILDNPYAYQRANVLPYPSTQLGLKSLWDRSVLSSGLSDTGASDSLLGLAEFSNKNFLGIRSLYGELYSLGGIHHYAHPSLNETNISNVLEAFGQEGIEATEDKDGVARSGIYISKVSNGLKVVRHSRLTYLGAALSNGMPPGGEITLYNQPATLTIHDDLVEKEYLQILLPLAVNYSRACLEYFFHPNFLLAYFDWNPASKKITVTIISNNVNRSYTGKFSVYWDDDAGNRTLLVGPISGSIDGSNPRSAITADFDVPASTENKTRDCIVVFQGDIINPNSTFVDPVDSGRNIDVCRAILPGPMQYADRHPTIKVKVEGVKSLSVRAPHPEYNGAPWDVSALNTTITLSVTNVFSILSDVFPLDANIRYEFDPPHQLTYTFYNLGIITDYFYPILDLNWSHDEWMYSPLTPKGSFQCGSAATPQLFFGLRDYIPRKVSDNANVPDSTKPWNSAPGTFGTATILDPDNPDDQ